MKKQIIAGAVLAILATTGAYTYASSTSTGSVNRTEIMDLVKKVREGVTLTTDEQTKLDAIKSKKVGKYNKTGSGQTVSRFEMGGAEGMGKMMGKGFSEGIQYLTDAEKTSLESMTDAQKQAFFETKMTEQKAKMDAHENVIDKLLAGQSLTAEEQIVKAEIIKERAEQKTKKAEMETKMAAIKVILDKQKAGTALTNDEQTTLDSMKKEHKGNGPRGNFKNQSKDQTSTGTTTE